MIGLLVPWVISFLLFAIIFFVIKRKYIITILLTIIISILAIHYQLFPLHLKPGAQEGIPLKVCSYNINTSPSSDINKLKEIAASIISDKSSIVFLQEDFMESAVIIDSLISNEYPYSNYQFKCRDRGHYVYSKYKLLSSDILYGNGTILRTDVNINNDTIVFYGCHLFSNNYSENNDYLTPNSINNTTQLFQYISNINNASKVRIKQIEMLQDDMDSHEHCIILCGDLNDVCGSKCLSLIENIGLKDCWWDAGLGYGATIKKPLPYRIDHIMYTKSNKLHLNTIQVIKSNGLSDHNKLVANFIYSKEL